MWFCALQKIFVFLCGFYFCSIITWFFFFPMSKRTTNRKCPGKQLTSSCKTWCDSSSLVPRSWEFQKCRVSGTVWTVAFRRSDCDRLRRQTWVQTDTDCQSSSGETSGEFRWDTRWVQLRHQVSSGEISREFRWDIPWALTKRCWGPCVRTSWADNLEGRVLEPLTLSFIHPSISWVANTCQVVS